MQRANHLVLMLSLAAVLVLGHLIGCAAPPSPEAGQPPEAAPGEAAQLPPEAVDQTLQAADQAFQDEQYERAAQLYASLQQAEAELTPEQQELVQTRLKRIESIQHQQAVEETPAVSRGEAPAALEEAERLVQEGSPEQAAPMIQALDKMWDDLPVLLRVRVDELRRSIAESSDALGPLAKREKVRRGEKYLDVGVRARKQNNYAMAARCLDAAAAFEVSLGWIDNRTLRSNRRKVHKRLTTLTWAFEAGKAAHEAGDYETATNRLGDVVEAGIKIGDGRLAEARQLLEDAEQKLQQQRQEVARQETEKATQLLEKAGSLVEEEEYEEAAAALAQLQPLAERLDQAQKGRLAELRQSVVAAGGPLPAATEEEKRQVALNKLEEALTAYEQKRYVDAGEALDLVAGMDVDLGRRNSRKLRETRREVTAELERLRRAFQEGMSAYQAEDYQAAREKLGMVARSDIQLEDQMKQKAAETLAALEKAGRQQEVQQVVRREQQAQAIEKRAGQILDALGTVSDLLARADEAIAAEDLGEAESALKRAGQLLQKEDVKDLPAAAELSEKVNSRMATVASMKEELAEREKTRQQVAALIEEAKKLAETDLLAAEKQVLEARDLAAEKDISLSPAQQAVAAEIAERVRSAMWQERALAAEQCQRIVRMADRYESRGEYRKPAELLGLVEQARPAVAGSELKRQATNLRVQMKQKAADQQAAAQEIVQRFDRARALLERGEFKASMHGAILQQARDAGLAGQPLIDVYQAAVQFLEKDVAGVLEETEPDYGQMAADLMERAEPQMHRQLAEHYLQNDAPELARPHLRSLLDEGDHAGWAQQKLDNLSALQAAAEDARLRAIAPEVDGVYGLARDLDALLKEGKVQEARSVRGQLRDARVRLAVKKARMALDRGAWQVARDVLDAASVEGASAEAASAYESVRKEAECRARAAGELEEAREAIAGGTIEKASGLLQSAGGRSCLGAAQQIKLNTLTAVLEPVRARKANWMAMRSWQERTMARDRERLQELQQRQKVWQSYHRALEALVVQCDLGKADSLFATALEGREALMPGERQTIENVRATVQKAVADADALLDQAQQQVEDGRYAAASVALEKVKQSGGYSVSEELKQRAQQVAQQIEQAEQKAGKLYAEAVQAHQAGDVDRLAQLLSRLESEYSGTRVYQKNQ